MTEVTFHFNVPDKVAYLCRLLRKVTAMGKQALVLLPPDLVRDLDQALWTFSQPDFIAHALATDDARVRDRSPILLTSFMCEVAHRDVLINAMPAPPPVHDGFEKLLEIVGLEAEDRQQARARWKTYTQQGMAIRQHDAALSAKGAT